MNEVRGVRGARRPRKLVVPDVAGLALADAQIVLDQAGFAPATPRYTLSYEPEGTVVAQQPMRGLLVDSTMQIELGVSMPSWIRFMPQIYQVSSDDNNAFNLSFLWIFQQIHDSVKNRIDSVHRLMQPADAPPEFLGWLASWIALQLEDDWDEVKRRRWLRFSPTLYNIRGTRRALEQLLEVYVGVRPTIYENEWPEGAFRVEVSSVIGESSTILPPMSLTNCFVVELPLSPSEVSEEQLIRIHRVIRAEKPAHTNYYLRFESAAAMDEWGPFMTIGEVGVGDE